MASSSAEKALRSSILSLTDNAVVFIRDNEYKCKACNIVLSFKTRSAAQAHMGTVKHRTYEIAFPGGIFQIAQL